MADIPSPPIDWHDEKEHRRKLAETIALILDGKSRALGTVTLTANQATTALSDVRITIESRFSFTPLTSNAKAEGTPYVTSRADGSCTLNHANNAQTDRTYDYVVFS